MCPLRLILIFLSATLAGFFVLKNLKSHPTYLQAEDNGDDVLRPNNSPKSNSADSSISASKVRQAIASGFWTVVDMASGRYLWKHLVSSSPASKPSD